MLEVSGLQVDYGAIRAVHDVSLTLAEGELVTLLGANGAGKSSTLMCIAGALPATAGSIRLEGADVTSARPEAMVHKGVATVPETRDVFPDLTVDENMQLGAYTRRSDAEGVAVEIPHHQQRRDDQARRQQDRDRRTDPARRQLAALGHDIERAVEARKVRRGDFADYDAFKAAHARNSAAMLGGILRECGVVDETLTREVRRLVCVHEVGGDLRSDLLVDADSLSYFDVNLPLYYERSGWEETHRRCVWGYRRLSKRARSMAADLSWRDEELDDLMDEVIREDRGGPEYQE